MNATPANAIPVITHGTVDSSHWLTVSCEDYDVYRRLPKSLEFEGKIHAKMGWNSDRGVAFYEANNNLAFPR